MTTAAVSGEWRRPVNTSADEKGGIHDDETASSLGFEGGTIAGSIHMEQFVPLLVAHFGDDWWRRGGLSLYFTAATMHAQPVRCHLQPTADNRADIWMENEEGVTVMQGTGALGVDDESTLKQRTRDIRPATDIRMFADVAPGVPCAPVPTRAKDASVDERLRVITEPMDCYTDPSTHGGRVLPIAALVHLMRAAEPQIAPIKGPFVGMFGAIEIEYINGPAVAEHDYLAEGEAIGLSESPKTEIIWHKHTLRDAQSGDEVARMIKMDRLLKGASPLWTD